MIYVVKKNLKEYKIITRKEFLMLPCNEVNKIVHKKNNIYIILNNSQIIKKDWIKVNFTKKKDFLKYLLPQKKYTLLKILNKTR